MNKVWVVMGSTGEFSDRTEWPVIGFTSEIGAMECIAALDEKMQQMPQEWRKDRWAHQSKIKAHMAALDPQFMMDYTGTKYFFYEVEIAQATSDSQ